MPVIGCNCIADDTTNILELAMLVKKTKLMLKDRKISQ